MKLISAYQGDAPKPAAVARWEREAEHAETAAAATAQLTYRLLLQVRTVKLLLIWVLVVVPVAAVVVTVVLAGVLDSGSDF